MEALEQFWLEHSLTGDDTLDVDPAVEALCELYRLGSHPPPDHVLVLDSPLAARIAWPALRMYSELLNVYAPVPPSRTRRLHHLVDGLVRGPVSRRLTWHPSLAESVWALLEGYLPWARGLRGFVLGSGEVAPPTPFSGLGCGNPGWLAHDELLKREGWTPDKRWPAAHALALAGVWDSLLTRRCAILVRRPVEVRSDSEGRLHSLTGPAYRWGDGFRGYAIQGVEVPGWVILEPERVTLDYLLEVANLEVRRVLIECFGRERFLTMNRAAVVHEDRDGAGMPRRLMTIPGVASYVEVQCPSTGHVHFLCVPPTVTRCHDAVAWTFRKSPRDYAPLVEA